MCRNPRSSITGRGGRRRRAVLLRRRLSFCRPCKIAHIAKLHALAGGGRYLQWRQATGAQPSQLINRPMGREVFRRTGGTLATRRTTAKSMAQRSFRHPPASGGERHDRALGTTEETDNKSVEANLHGERGRFARF